MTIQEIFDNCTQVLTEKGREYGYFGTTNKDVARYMGVSPAQVCFTYLMKHINVLKRISEAPHKFTEEDLKHRTQDAINFLVLFMFEIEDEVFPVHRGGLAEAIQRETENVCSK